MRQKHYTDGTPSREIEEDWETCHDSLDTGKDRTSLLTQARDQLNQLKDLVTVCAQVLTNDHQSVALVLLNYVVGGLNDVERGLRKV